MHLIQIPKSNSDGSLKKMIELLDCELVQPVMFTVDNRQHCCWVDESGLLREPFQYPRFLLLPYSDSYPLTGYGLITDLDMEGEISDCTVAIPKLGPLIRFEPWKARINPDNVIDQLMRIYIS